MSVAGTKNFDQPPHDSNRTHLVFSTSGLLLGSRAPLVFSVSFQNMGVFQWFSEPLWVHAVNLVQWSGNLHVQTFCPAARIG